MHPDCVRPYSQPHGHNFAVIVYDEMYEKNQTGQRTKNCAQSDRQHVSMCYVRQIEHVPWARMFTGPAFGSRFRRQQGLHVCACAFVFDICTDVTFTRTTCGSMLTDSEITRRVLGIPLKHIVMLWQSKHTNPLENQKHCAMVVGFCVVFGRWRFSERWHFSDSLSAGVRSSTTTKKSIMHRGAHIDARHARGCWWAKLNLTISAPKLVQCV